MRGKILFISGGLSHIKSSPNRASGNRWRVKENARDPSSLARVCFPEHVPNNLGCGWRRRGGFWWMGRGAIDNDPRREIAVVEIGVRFLERSHQLVELVTGNARDRPSLTGRELARAGSKRSHRFDQHRGLGRPYRRVDAMSHPIQ